MADAIDEYYDLCEICDYDVNITAKIIYQEFKKDWVNKKCEEDNRLRPYFTKQYKLRFKESRIIEDIENLRVEKYKGTISRLLDADCKIILAIIKSIKGLF